MKNRIMNKLRSEKGASITFALLLFLVCTVLCAVIIAAATAAAGRMSRISDQERRYYAVSSAASMMKELIDGQVVSVAKVDCTTIDTTYTGGAITGESVVSTEETKYFLFTGEDANAVIANHEFGDGDSAYIFDNAAIKSISADAAKNVYKAQTLSSREMKLTSDFYGAAGLDYDALAVTILEDLDGEGKLTLTISNTYKTGLTLASDNEKYTKVMVFGMDQTVTNSTKIEEISSTTVSNNTFTVRSKKTEVEVKSMTWHLTDRSGNL
jgi:hypothetical protein